MCTRSNWRRKLTKDRQRALDSCRSWPSNEQETLEVVVVLHERRASQLIKRKYTSCSNTTYFRNLCDVFDAGKNLKLLSMFCLDSSVATIGGVSRLDVIPRLVTNHLAEFKEYGQRGLYLGLDPANPVVNRATRWMPPPPQSFALATDASVVSGRGFVRLGGSATGCRGCGLVGVVIRSVRGFLY
uniref:Uncharacterized protein n=1 Tax=Cannabis sativa TaxID=3483 RepID=A0A803Q2M2_CANSA